MPPPSHPTLVGLSARHRRRNVLIQLAYGEYGYALSVCKPISLSTISPTELLGTEKNVRA